MLTRNPIFLADEELLRGIALLQQAARQLGQSMTRMSGENLSHNDLQVMHCLYLHSLQGLESNAQMSLGALAHMTAMSKPALSRIINRLEKRKLLLCHTDVYDRRIRRVSLSSRAAQLYALCQHENKAIMYTAYQNAGATDVSGFIAVLKNIVHLND